MENSFLMTLLRESQKPRSTDFVQKKEQRYERLTKQLYTVMTSQYFNKYKVAEKLALKILHILGTDEYPDEYCRDYVEQMKYLHYHVCMSRNRQGMIREKPKRLSKSGMHMEHLEDFLYYVGIQNVADATSIAVSEVTKLLKEPPYNEVYRIGKYKYAENCNSYIIMYYYMHGYYPYKFEQELMVDLQMYLDNLIQEDKWLSAMNFQQMLGCVESKCCNCMGSCNEHYLHLYYQHCMAKLNNDKSVLSKHVRNFAQYNTSIKWMHSNNCPSELDHLRQRTIPLPYKLYESLKTSSLDLCRGSFSNVMMDSVIINLSKRSVLCAMCLSYKDWVIDRSNVMWHGVRQRYGAALELRSIDILLRLKNNVLIKFNKDMRNDGDETGEEEKKSVEVDKITKQGKKKKMVNQIVQTKSLLKDCRVKQTQTCMEESVIKDHKKLKQRIKALESEKSKTQREINNLRDKLNNMNMKTAAINHELHQSQNALKVREAEMKTYKQQADLLRIRNFDNDQKMAEKDYEYKALLAKYNTLKMCSVDINKRNQDLQEKCEQQKLSVLENILLKDELQKTKEAYYRVTGELHMMRAKVNDRQNFVWDICNILKMHLKNGIGSIWEALQKFERRSLMIVMEFEAETGTEENFKFMEHMSELKDKFKEFENYCKITENLLSANKLKEAVDMLKVHEVVWILEQCPNILFNDISKMITLLSNKDARIRKEQTSGACYLPIGGGGGDQAKSNKPTSSKINEYTDANGKYHLLFMRVKENVYNAENDDIIVQALKEIRRKNNNRMSFLTYEQIVNRVQQRINENGEENSCCICFHGYDNIPIRVLVCNHKFHKHCIEHWFQTNNVCPICRSVIAP